VIARLLVEEDSRQSVREILERDCITNAFITSRLHRWLDGSLSLSKLSGEVWVVEDGGSFEALLYVGANLVPTLCSDQAIDALVGRLAQEVRRSSSITGPASVVLSLWEKLEPSWGSARVIRSAQPLLVIDSAPLVEADVDVRAVEPVELSLIFPSAVEMFTQEVGTSPLGIDNGASFRSRLAELILQGRAFARIENGEGRLEDLEFLKSMTPRIAGKTLCALGDAACGPMDSILGKFRDEFVYHIEHKKCPKHSCQLVTYSH